MSDRLEWTEESDDADEYLEECSDGRLYRINTQFDGEWNVALCADGDKKVNVARGANTERGQANSRRVGTSVLQIRDAT
jgi:hypothetical protein